ncbi:unnamed protein product [Heligmosomoides polygyrus]|uniref:Uncharacterized protein n=1 Tax=Heligmosomoides polygyrus TaxID=6339 RepID=A0A183FGC4_HELPZ|nr:unnamed protein product [Heligmosomoides polygyrus]
MIWGATTSDGKMSLVFVDVEVELKEEMYLKLVLGNDPDPFLTSGTSHGAFSKTRLLHTSRVSSSSGVNASFHIVHEEWPSKSSVLNPLDFSAWSGSELQNTATGHNNLDSLKAAFTKAWTDLHEDYLHASCDAFMTRLRSCMRV